MTPNTTGAGMPYDIPPRAHPEHMSGYAEEIPMDVSPNPSVVEAARRVLEWWPENSENGRAGQLKGDGFADDVRALRQALAALNKDQADAG
jgi:hypothetical protein